MCRPISFLTEQDPERFQRLTLVLWKALLVARPCLALPQFRLHMWHTEREANPSGQPRSGRAGRGEGARGKGVARAVMQSESELGTERQNRRKSEKRDETGCRL